MDERGKRTGGRRTGSFLGSLGLGAVHCHSAPSWAMGWKPVAAQLAPVFLVGGMLRFSLVVGIEYETVVGCSGLVDVKSGNVLMRRGKGQVSG